MTTTCLNPAIAENPRTHMFEHMWLITTYGCHYFGLLFLVQ